MNFSWKTAAARWLDMAYPRSCAGCGGPTADAEGFLCWNCLSAIPFVQLPFCARCGDPIEGRVDHAYTCYTCTADEIHFERARSAVRYRGVAQQVLRAFKYDAALWLQPDLDRLLHGCVESQFTDLEADAVAAVPLYAARERERGFNQAALLAAALAHRMRKPFLPGVLRRVRPTPTQTHLTAPQRAANVKDAFEVRKPAWIEGQRLLLVDDVMTTGATVNECARILKEGGAARVYVATLARG